MKFQEKNFHDIHEINGNFKGKSIWIAGSDPTLDTYPQSFFDDKISITLHLAHLKFPAATFRYSSEYDRSTYLAKFRNEYATLPLIAAYPMYGKTKEETKTLLSGFNTVYFHKMVNPTFLII